MKMGWRFNVDRVLGADEALGYAYVWFVLGMGWCGLGWIAYAGFC
jgi:hypothetical protein